MLSIPERPAPKAEVPEVEKLLQQLVRETHSRPTKAVNPTVMTTLEKMLLSFLDGQRRRQRPPPKQRPSQRDWSDVMCFSCGKLGHAATRCPDFSKSFPFLQPGWQKEKTPFFYYDTSAGVPVLNQISNGRLTCLRLLETFVQRCRLGVPPGLV